MKRGVIVRGESGRVAARVRELLSTFAERGVHALKGVPGEWTIFNVVDASARA